MPATQIAGVTTSGMPVGSVKVLAHGTVPTGYLLCDGSAVSRTTYASLFSFLGTTHGQGDGSTTFNLPDYRGRFLRGVDGTAGNDPDKASRTAMATGGNAGNNVGSVQGHQFADHTHTSPYYAWRNDSGSYHGNGTTAGHIRDSRDGYGIGTNDRQLVTYGAASGAGSENRPVNANVNYIIAYI